MRSEKLILLDPTIGDDCSGKRLATRLKSFEGKVLGLLWNSKPGGDVLLKGVGARLAATYGLKDVVFRYKDRIGSGAPAETINELVSNCDAVLIATGD
jgi:hypothetical protein